MNHIPDWMDILEDHFSRRKKAFLIFDNKYILQYISNYAREILEFEEDLTGITSFKDLFPPLQKNPEFLFDKNNSYQSIHDLVYTTPSGRPKELRLNLEKERELNGYVVWLEERLRDVTGTYRRVSSFEPFKRIAETLNFVEVGYLIINKGGIVEDYNQNFKTYLGFKGEWHGRNIFSFPAFHQNKVASFLMKCLESKNKVESKVFKLIYQGQNQTFLLHWSGIALTDIQSDIIGAFICTSRDKEK